MYERWLLRGGIGMGLFEGLYREMGVGYYTGWVPKWECGVHLGMDPGEWYNSSVDL